MPSTAPDLSRNRFWILLSILAVLCFALCLWNIDFGIPTVYHPDELKKFGIIERIMQGRELNYNIQPLIHPGLMVNLVAAICATAERLGMSHQTHLIIIAGRVVSALFLAATVIATALLGATLASRRAGLLAAAIIAFSPLMTVHARYLKEDSFLTFFTTASLLGAAWWSVAETPARRRAGLIVCAAAAGFAASCKYVGLVFPILLAGFIALSRRRRGELPLFLAVALAAIALGSIQLLMHPKQGYAEIAYAIARGSMSNQSDAPLRITQWPDLGTFFLFHGINIGLGWPLTLAAMWGLFAALRQRLAHPILFLTAIATLAWYFVTELTPLKRAIDTERYIMPCVPLMAILAARVLDAARRSRIFLGAGWLCVAVLAAHSAAIAYHLRPDTRELAARWLFDEHMQRKPRPVAWIAAPANYQINQQMMPGVTFVNVPYKWRTMQYDTSVTSQTEILTISHFATDRYEDYPRLSRNLVKDLKKLRAEFPYVKIFKKPGYARAGFHNPVIEIRFRHEFEKK